MKKIFSIILKMYNLILQFGKPEVYEVLNVLEFTSSRKRMSVVVRMPNGTIKLMTKGADTVIYERLGPDNQYKEVTLQHLEDFATRGGFVGLVLLLEVGCCQR